MPVFIFEGVQGVGKTALLQELHDTGLVAIADIPRTSAQSTSDYISTNIRKTLEDAKSLMDCADMNKFYAVDRFAASEYVFGQICERKQDYAWIEQLEREMAKHHILTVYIFAQHGFICSNIWSRRAVYVADLMIKNLPDAFQLYSKYLEFSPIPSVSYYNNHTQSLKTNAVKLWVTICDGMHKLGWKVQ